MSDVKGSSVQVVQAPVQAPDLEWVSVNINDIEWLSVNDECWFSPNQTKNQTKNKRSK